MGLLIQKKWYNKKIIIYVLTICIIQRAYGLNSVHAKKYVTLSFLKNKILRILLFEAAEKGNVSTIIDVIKRNGSLNEQSSTDGKTPLIVAIIHNHQDAVQTLLAAGALPSLKDFNDKNAFDYALESNNQKIITVLAQYM